MSASDKNADECVFCGIAEHRLPGEKLLETDLSIGILDIKPIRRGHALIMPKRHYELITDVPEAELLDLIQSVQRVARAIDCSLRPEGYNVIQNNGRAAGQVISHVHFHIVPRYKGEEVRFRMRIENYEEGEMEEVGRLIREGIEPE